MHRFKIANSRLITAMAFALFLSGCLMNAENDDTTAAAPPPPPPTGNQAPSISGTPPQTVKVGVMYMFAPQGSDADNDPLQFSIQNRPGWATFDAATGVLSGMPMLGSEGTYADITVAVSDGSESDSLPPFTVVVEPASAANMPPEISGTPTTSVVVGNNYSFTPTVFDADGDALTFSVTNRPSWAAFDSGTGALTGTPLAGDTGSYNNIAISVTDAQSNASLPAFGIAVVAANNAPSISGTPPTQGSVGQVYSFTPTASDPDGDTLTFSIQNRPGWASFDAASGALTGTPAAGDAGTHSNVVITVSDGSLNASLSAFDINVNAATGSATLTWTPPTLNDDGSVLNDLSGYRIYYGTSANNLSTRIEVNDATASSYVVTNLGPGTYFFGATAVNGAGAESDMSQIASKTIN